MKIILYVNHRGGKPVGVTVLTANHRYLGGYELPESEIKILRTRGQFQGHEIKSIRERPPSRKKGTGEMRAYEISGSKGTYLELRDGRYADTVTGDTSEDCSADEALIRLRAEATQHSRLPVCTTMTPAQLARHVGA